MKSVVLAVAACCILVAAAALAAEPTAAAAAPAPAAPAAVASPTADPMIAAAPQSSAPGAPPMRAPATPSAAASALPASASAGSLLQTILALTFVLALLAALAWAMKRYGLKANGPNATLRLVGSLSLGGRERILVVEVADQWIVVGAAPGRVNALATLPRQQDSPGATLAEGASSANFSDWLKKTIDKRNGK